VNEIGTLLILGGASDTQGFDCLMQAKNRGLRVFLTDKQEHLDKLPEITKLADAVEALDYSNPSECVEWARQRDENFVCVFGFREYSTISVAEVSSALGLPGNSPEAVRLIRNKYQTRKFLQQKGFTQPEIALCHNWTEAIQFVHQRNKACIVKPVSAMGSLGVTMIQDHSDWDKAKENLSDFEEFIVEEFVSGKEYSVEGIFHKEKPHVLAVTEKSIVGNGIFVESGHMMPADIPVEIDFKITQTVSHALTSIGLTWGVFHVEVWVDEDVVIGEIHIRPGGDYIHRMVELITDIELYGSVYDQVLNRKQNLKQFSIKRGAAISYLFPPKGIMETIKHVDKVKADPRCEMIKIHSKKGDKIGNITSSYDRSGFVLVKDVNNLKAKKHADALVQSIEFKMAE
jgi:biotin carboxylase